MVEKKKSKIKVQENQLPMQLKLQQKMLEIKQKSMVLSLLRLRYQVQDLDESLLLDHCNQLVISYHQLRMLHLYLTMVVGLENVEEFNFKGVN